MVPALPQPPDLDGELARIRDARHHDPFTVLGRHPRDGGVVVRAYLPQTAEAWLEDIGQPLARVPGSDFFTWQGPADALPQRYRIGWVDAQGRRHLRHDPYCFPPQIPEFDLHLFGQGRHWHAYRFLGAHPWEADGVRGVLFATWAPNAERVSVVGDFNHWDGRRHPMRCRGGSGVWELFVPGLAAGALYKFELRHRDSGTVMLKADPYARRFELRPRTACLVAGDEAYPWGDGDWLAARAGTDWSRRPLAIYEVHLGSWQRDADGGFLNYRELAHRLVDHVTRLGYTHVELMPVSEHPLDASWGYQPIGYYAPTSRFGTPEDFRYFVDHCHRHGIGVLLDWVPGHFPKDPHGLARFDGTALYEHADPRRGEHQDWGTLIFNYGRAEVRNFLLANALYWLEEYHVDGLRVDAVASMIYLDYSRKPGEWLPNEYGGNENLEAIEFLRELNTVAHQRFPGVLMVAEESTAWPGVSRPVHLGGLGFTMKWNMGWMNDTLEYFAHDPIHRKYHQDRLTFSLLYAFTENFILPFSHDEVVHGKRSLRYKMPGDEWQQFAHLRLLYGYQYTHPGKKLLFMGGEFGQGPEWSHDRPLDWYVLDYAPHQGLLRLVEDLNRLYREVPALHGGDFDPAGFEWIDCHDAEHSVLVYLRRAHDDVAVVALNFTPVPRFDYRIGLPGEGDYEEVFNSDSERYGGGNLGNLGGRPAEPVPWMGRPCSMPVTLPPLAAVIFRWRR